MVCDCCRGRAGGCDGSVLATKRDYGTLFCASDDKSTGGYASGSANNAAQTVTSDMRLYTVQMSDPVADLPLRVVARLAHTDRPGRLGGTVRSAVASAVELTFHRSSLTSGSSDSSPILGLDALGRPPQQF